MTAVPDPQINQSSTVPSKLQEAWQSVKAKAVAALSNPKPWIMVTATALLAGAVTAAAGFGGLLGAGLASTPFFALAFVAIQSGAMGGPVDFLSFGALGGLALLLGSMPTFSVVLTVILGGIAAVGIAGILAAHILKARRRNQTINSLPPEAQKFYRAVMDNPRELHMLDRATLRRNGLAPESHARAFLFSEDAFYKHIKELDVRSDDDSLKELNQITNSILDEFDSTIFPNVETIRCDREWLVKNASALKDTFHGLVKIGNLTLCGPNLRSQLKRYEQLANLSDDAKPFYRKIIDNHSLTKKLDINFMIENNFTKFADIEILLGQLGDQIETIEADFSKIGMGKLDDKTKQWIRKFDGSNFPKLKHLTLSNGESVEIKNLRKCPDLRTITLANCSDLKAETLCSDLIQMRHLNKISVENCGQIMNFDEINIISDCKPECEIIISP